MSTKVTPQEVRKIAQLARLGLTDEEITRATAQLSSILEHFSQIQKIKTKNIPTSDDVTSLKNITRTDEARPETLCRTDALLEAAPEIKNQQFKVKAVFEE